MRNKFNQFPLEISRLLPQLWASISYPSFVQILSPAACELKLFSNGPISKRVTKVAVIADLANPLPHYSSHLFHCRLTQFFLYSYHFWRICQPYFRVGFIYKCRWPPSGPRSLAFFSITTTEKKLVLSGIISKKAYRWK